MYAVCITATRDNSKKHLYTLTHTHRIMHIHMHVHTCVSVHTHLHKSALPHIHTYVSMSLHTLANCCVASRTSRCVFPFFLLDFKIQIVSIKKIWSLSSLCPIDGFLFPRGRKSRSVQRNMQRNRLFCKNMIHEWSFVGILQVRKKNDCALHTPKKWVHKKRPTNANCGSLLGLAVIYDRLEEGVI